MVDVFLLGALAAALFGVAAFEWSDDDNDPVDEDVDTELEYDGSEVLEGTEGDDTLPAGQDEDLAPREINLLGGDDTAVVEQASGMTVSGGDGDDTLTSTTVDNNLYGDAGDDTLTGMDATSMYGGAGDDVITWNGNFEHNSSTSQIDGGDGDDIVNIVADAGTDEPDRGGAIITGGTGSDAFNINLDLKNSRTDYDDDGTLTSSVARIDDFDPVEDSLVINIERDVETEDREAMVEFTQTEQDDGVYTTELLLRFAATESAREAVTVINFRTSAPFSLDDIEINGL